MKLWLIPLNDKRGEELCTHMYSPFRRFIAKFKVKRTLREMGYDIRKNVLNKKEIVILNERGSLVGKLKTVHYNRSNIEPTVFLKESFNFLENTIKKYGCDVEYIK